MDIKKLTAWEQKTGKRYLNYIMSPMDINELTVGEIVELANIIADKQVSTPVEATKIVMKHFIEMAKELSDEIMAEMGDMAETLKIVQEVERRG
jgi:Asp-tRNA(Asn)/Glu-tRNA(Gln) amidotransferase B subunit